MYGNAPRFVLVFALLLVVSGMASADMLTASGDPILGIHSTDVGTNSSASTGGTGAGQYPTNNGGEPPSAAIDGNTGTKYLNFGNGASDVQSATKGVGTGFYITPAFGSSLLQQIRIATANDSENRDPITVSIEGANGGDLTLGASWTLIVDDLNVGINSDPGRNT